MANRNDERGQVGHMHQLISVLGHIDQLVKEEERLYAKSELTDEDHMRLTDVEVALDQCGDLLRRRALRDFDDPSKRKMPPTNSSY